MADKDKTLSLKEIRERELESALELAQDTETDNQKIAKWNLEQATDQEQGQREISIAEEYRMLLEGRRVQSRRSNTKTVLEKQRQEQLDMMKQAELRQKEKNQLKKRKQKLEKLFSKNESEEESQLSNPLKSSEGPKQRRESKNKEKRSKNKEKGRRSLKPDKSQDPLRSRFDALKTSFVGSKRNQSQVSLTSDNSVSSEQWQRGPKRLDVGKELQKPFNTEIHQRDNEPAIGLSKAHLFKEPELYIALDSDSKSDSSYEVPKHNLLLQNQSQTTIIDGANPSPSKIDPSDDLQKRLRYHHSVSQNQPRVANDDALITEKQLTPSKQKGVKDFQDQLREFMLLDKIIPDVNRTEGCVVQIINDDNSQRFGRILAIFQDENAVRIKDLFSEIEELVSIQRLRFLARAYTCSLEDLDFKSFPQELSSIIQDDKSKQIVLVQMIQAMQGEVTQKSENPEVNTLSQRVIGPSVHRLNALVPHQEHEFRLVPVVFQQGTKRQSNKKELPAQLSQADNLVIDQAELTELDSMCYRDPLVAKSLLSYARLIQKAWRDNYLKKTERVEVTADNINDLLFTICSFSERSERFEREQEREKESGSAVPSFRSTKVKVGILLNFRTEMHEGTKSIIAFLKLFPVKVGQKERVEWVKLRKSQIISNESLGFVQIASLACQETHTQSLQNELKVRQLKMISKAESLLERALNLREAEPQLQVAICDSDESLAQEAQFFISQKGKSETCKICKYQTNLEGVKFFNCCKCNENFHYKCLDEHQRNIGVCEKSWRCPDCIRCNNCFSQKQKEQILVCRHCNTPTHYDCLPTSFKNRLKAFPSEQPDTSNPLAIHQTMIPSEYICDRCISCQNCQRREAGEKKQNKWSKDFKFCSSCNKKRDRKEYCSICEQFWPTQDHTTKEYLIKCGLCQMWIHLECDRMLIDKSVIDKFINTDTIEEIAHTHQSRAILNAARHSTLVYSCPNCRKIGRCNFLEQVLSIMINEDKRKDFVDPFWEKMANTEYLNIIKRPICFDMIRHDIRASKKYLMHPETFKADIMRIFWNARMFNSMQSEIHKSALRLNEKCSQILSQGRLWEIIETNGKASLDEERYSLFIRRKAKHMAQLKTGKRAANSSQTPEQLFDNQSSYLLKAKELFQLQEQINARQYGVNISDLEKALLSQCEDEKGECHQISFCQTLSCLIEPRVLFGLLEEANRRLISQNLSKRFEFTDQAGRGGAKQLYDQEMYTNLSLIGQNSLSSQAATSARLIVAQPKQSGPAQRDQWFQLMEELRNNEDRDGDWYSNPIKISFDDPRLIFVEMCYLCGSFGNSQDFLSCNLCGESFHPYCLPEPKEETAQFQEYWRCYNCIFCEKCHSSKQWEGLLICAVCDKVDHYWCLEPQLIQIPECNWKCPDCFKCVKCDSKQFFSEADIQNRVNLDPNEKFVVSNDFEFCYQCGLNESRKTFCNICGEKTGVGLEVNCISQPQGEQKGVKPVCGNKKINATQESACHEQSIFKCNVCHHYSHLDCSRTDLQTLQAIAKRQGLPCASDAYKCIDCLLIGKLPNFYFYQQCELYENIHKSLRRQAMIRQLCHDILAKYFTNLEQVSASVQADLYVNMFIDQNQDWLRQDSLINQWLLMLESDLDIIQVDSNSESTLTNEQPTKPEVGVDVINIGQTLMQESWSDFDMREVIDVDDHPQTDMEVLRKDLYGHKDTFFPSQRNLYLHLYFTDLTRYSQNKSFLSVEDLAAQMRCISEQGQADLSTLFINVEFRAVLKLRQRYCKWFEHLMLNTLKQSGLFITEDQEQLSQKSFHQVLQEDQFAEPEMIITTSQKPNLRERPSSQNKRDAPENEPKQLIPMCQEEDTPVENPQKLLKCVLCHQNGERRISGRLIPFKTNRFVHVNCALWTYGVQEGQEEGILCTEIYNFHFAFKAFQNQVCVFCHLPGASLVCNQKKCNTAYHFSCAYKSRKVQLREASTYCENCTIKHADGQPGLPAEFKDNHRKRIVIVKNILPQCTDAFNDQVKNKHKLAQSQQSALNSSPDINKKDNDQANEESDLAQKKDGKNEVFVQCNNWSPYYYDMFNRVGNLTVLSLSKRRNAVIENLHAFKNRSKTWAERLIRKAQEKDSQDYAAVRIYWKYPDQSGNQEYKVPQENKGFYLFHSGDQVTEIYDNDFDLLNNFYSRRLQEQQSKQMRLVAQQSRPAVKAVDFWEQQIQNLRRRYNKFCQENTYLTVQFIQGLEKFPIQYWNNPGEKINLELKELNIASFFFKSALKDDDKHKQEKSTKPQEAPQAPQNDKKVSSLDSIFTQMLQANQVNIFQQNVTAEGGLTFPFCSGLNLLDNEDQQELSTKHMNYEQIMARLGKKTLKVKIKERRDKEKADLQEQISFNAQGENKSESDHQNAGFLEIQSESGSEFGVKEKAEITGQPKSKDATLRRKAGSEADLNEISNKGNDINQAMKYRAAKLNPKHVEVWISKIHRNGLFACQLLQPKDIVIEYVGEKIRESVANQREKYYEKLGVGDCYLFSLDKDYIIDATFFGSKARYINHSCEPNLVSEKITVNGEKHIIFVAKRQITPEEELTFDYQFDPENENNKLECFCGSAKCRSRLN